MSIVLVQPRFIFGLRSNIGGNVLYLDEHTIIYPSGSNCVIFNHAQKTQNFIPCSEKSYGMTALALTPHKQEIAVAERGNMEKGDKAVVNIYDLKTLRKRKILSMAELRSDEFVSLAFSHDSKYLAAQSNQPDWTIVCWIWEKSKLLASIRATSPQSTSPCYQVSFSPSDSSVVCTVGAGICKLFRYTEGLLKQFAFQRHDPLNYLCIAWASSEIALVGSDNGKVQVLEVGELRHEFTMNAVIVGTQDQAASGSEEVSAMGGVSLEAPVTSIVTFSKGFACACGPGLVHLFEKSEEEFYKKIKEIQIPPDPWRIDALKAQEQILTWLAISPSEEMLIGSTSSNQLYFFMLASAEITKNVRVPFEVLTQIVHSNMITGLDLCIRKPLIATCSTDKSVRIWNYKTWELELYKEFSQEAYSVALHPSGLYVLVGFEDSLQMMNLLIDDIKTFHTFSIKSCRECCFSHGGHYFAAVLGNIVQIYSTATFENISNMTGHNARIKGIVWNTEDTRIVSCGMDGAVYEWEVLTMRRVSENVLKNCKYNGVALSPDGKIIFAVGTDASIKEIIDSQVLRTVDAHEMVLTSVVLSYSGRMMFAGTNTGSIRSMKFPLSDPGEWVQFQAHECPVTKMKMTYDDQYLVTVSEDSCVLVWRIQDKEGRGIKRDKDITFAEEILITKSDLEEKNQLADELRLRVDELKSENAYQLRLKDLNYGTKIKELTERFVTEMDALKEKNQALKTEKDRDEITHQEEVSKMMEQHTTTIEDLESLHNMKLMREYEKYQELLAKGQLMQEDYERQLEEAEERKELALEELTESYENKLQELDKTLQQANRDFDDARKTWEETERQIEEDVDREVMTTKARFETILRDEKATTQKVKAELTLFKKKYATMQKELEDRKEDIRKGQVEIAKLNNIIKNLDKDIIGLKKEIQERDDTIQDKEKRIYDLKKKNQELEKFKFVLDYKIKDLRKQIEPRDNEIRRQKHQIAEMEGELGKLHTRSVILEQRIEEESTKLKAAEKELFRVRRRLREREVVIHRMKNDIYRCVGNIQEPKVLKEEILSIYRKHVSEEDIEEPGEHDDDVTCELTRQREFLESTVSTLRKQMNNEYENQKHDHLRVMQENVLLVREVNQLRHELKSCRATTMTLEALLGLHRKNNKMSAAEVVQQMSDTTRNAVLGRELDETKKVVQLQQQEILRLRNEVCQLKVVQV